MQEKEKESGPERSFEEVVAKILPYMVKHTHLQI